MPRARSRSSLRLCPSSSIEPSSSAAVSEPSATVMRARRRFSARATSRDCAPSCRLRSSRRRSPSAASTSRAREARSSTRRARSSASRRWFSSSQRGGRAGGPDRLGVLRAVVHDGGDVLAVVVDLGRRCGGRRPRRAARRAPRPRRRSGPARASRTRAPERGRRARARGRRAGPRARARRRAPPSACARRASRRGPRAPGRRGTRTAWRRRPRTPSTAARRPEWPRRRRRARASRPPLANTGTRLRRSGAAAARHWRTSMPTATRQRPSVSAEPSASAASLRPASRSMSSTLRGHPPRQSVMTSSASLTSSAGTGASGIST